MTTKGVLALAVLAAVVSGCTGSPDEHASTASTSTSAPTPTPTTAMPMDNTTTRNPEPAPVHNDNSLWEVVSAVASRMPLTSGDTYGQAIGSPMVQTANADNFSQWAGSSGIQLADDVQIIRSELRNAGDATSPKVSIAGFNITGRCVTVDEMKSHYPDVRITEPPSAPGQATTWATDQPWGRISFEVHDDAEPACLVSVYFKTVGPAPGQ